MYYPKRWRDRAHKVTQTVVQGMIGVGNELIGEDGIKGTRVGMRTIMGVVGGLTAAMGSDLGADAMWAALGSGAEAGGKAAVRYWRGKRPEEKEQTQPAPVAEPVQQAAPAPAQAPVVVIAGSAHGSSLAALPAVDVLDALSPETRAAVEAELAKQRATKRGRKKPAPVPVVEEVVVTSAAKTG